MIVRTFSEMRPSLEDIRMYGNQEVELESKDNVKMVVWALPLVLASPVIRKMMDGAGMAPFTGTIKVDLDAEGVLRFYDYLFATANKGPFATRDTQDAEVIWLAATCFDVKMAVTFVAGWQWCEFFARAGECGIAIPRGDMWKVIACIHKRRSHERAIEIHDAYLAWRTEERKGTMNMANKKMRRGSASDTD